MPPPWPSPKPLHQAKTYTYLTGHQLLGFEKSDGSMFYFLSDALSTVRDVVDSDGDIVASYEFSEYGQRISSSESGASSEKTFVGGLSVQDEVADTGLMLMGHRFYEPEVGRFLNRDPIGYAGDLNLFRYAGSRPSQAVDPAGLQEMEHGMSFSDFMNQARQDVSAFFHHLLITAGFAPGPVGATATMVEITTKSGEGQAFPIPIGLSPAVIAVLKNRRQAKKFQDILEKHLSSPQKLDCVPTSQALMKDLNKLGIPADFLEVRAATDFMFIGNERFSESGYHVAVIIGDRVFDKITGPSGLLLEEFKALMRASSVDPVFKITKSL